VGAVPPEWKNAFITPVHKTGAAGLVQNYRPISLTCVARKIMERIVCRRIFDRLYNNNILHRPQHGFLKNRSTKTNLLESLSDWTLCQKTDQKPGHCGAFDVVSHDKLFARLHSYGIRGALLVWLQNFFSNHTHVTKVDLSLSDVAFLVLGVVQGSGIGL